MIEFFPRNTAINFLFQLLPAHALPRDKSKIIDKMQDNFPASGNPPGFVLLSFLGFCESLRTGCG